jgi:hypothetical protein
VRIGLEHRKDGRRFDFTVKGEALIGSSEECGIRLDDVGVAARHARVRISTLGIELDDLVGASTTSVNSYATSKHFLSANDEVQIGSASLKVYIDASEEKPGASCRRCGAELVRGDGDFCAPCREKQKGGSGSSRFRRADDAGRVPPGSGRFPKIPVAEEYNPLEMGTTTRINPGHLALERLLGDYAPLGLLGEGSQGKVYKLQHRKTGVLAAGKLIWASAKKARARFDREVEALKLLQHPSIVGLVDVRESPEAIILLMEYVDGSSLAALLKKQPTLEPRRALRLGARLAEGLAFAAAKGVIHRDVKPSNVLLAPGDTPKLADFGLVAFNDARTKLTAEGQWIGTPHYMAPEQMGGREAEARTDVWGLGVTLYQAIAGRLPFEANVPADLFKRVMNESVDMGPLEPLIGPAGVEVLRGCLEKNVEDRPHAAELAPKLAQLTGE